MPRSTLVKLLQYYPEDYLLKTCDTMGLTQVMLAYLEKSDDTWWMITSEKKLFLVCSQITLNKDLAIELSSTTTIQSIPTNRVNGCSTGQNVHLLNVYIQNAKVVEGSLQSVSPELVECRDLELAVPGTYRADYPLVSIASFAPELVVI
ncbi:hypothetical protein NC653_022251 [Populus alba x Populus x berolinensis]|uniref:Uncharacterized protein n=1 Tax=Populus alba x Populus x berolinensis TaxID=444605 RepID=A0AAD6MEF3_9ROSI|nr:hypothetical protein NC653_022251 [Populus alba x Populus x berolinensis]